MALQSDFKKKLDDALDQDPKVIMRDPFASIDAPYFTTEERNQQLALLEHLSRYSAMLFVVEGEAGSGKTAFMEEFARLQAETAIISRVKASILMSAGQLLEKIYSGFPRGVTGLTPDASFGPLLKFSLKREEQGETVLILIDDAHELTGDAISMLLDMMSLANENQPAPHVVLFSNHNLKQSMDPYLQARFDQLAHIQELRPFSEEEVKSYLLHRVRSIGGQINLPFTDKQVKTIIDGSKGYPGAINRIAREMLGKREKAKFGFPITHMALLSLVAVAIIGAVIFNSSTTDDGEQKSAIALSTESKRIVSPTIAKIEQVQQELEQDESFALPPIPVDARVRPAESTAPKAAVTEPQTAVVAAPIALSKAITTTTDTAEEKTEEQAEPQSISPVPATVVTQGSVADVTSAVADNSQQDLFDKANWLLSQNPNRYSLQLLGAYTLSAVQDFIKNQGSLDDFAYFKTEHNNRDWYVVVYGLYRNRGQAIAAIEDLPKDLQALTPWARSVRGIQQDIRKVQ